MNGHSDVVMGAVMLNNEELYKRLKYLQNAVGAVPSPFDCFLVNRGIKTLAIRMRQHMESGIKVAKALEQNPRISKIIYPGEHLVLFILVLYSPFSFRFNYKRFYLHLYLNQNKTKQKGLESHPQHELYKQQMKGFGGMISVYLKGGLAETVTFLKSLKVIYNYNSICIR
jgi:cystathionine gamma-lyase